MVIKKKKDSFFHYLSDEVQLFLYFVNGRYLIFLIWLEKTTYIENALFSYVCHF